ncbi:antitoxin [Testudinibacter sp. TR-2022]|uniref:antitoxin n=1 Tax=Testudinibacter sp. TR-2022 TaxID=2585029 RepID=UPI001118A04F|nr:type II toxin-antitoxin system VapB family antitoxin [Testudinibacter sp. TR-2022]TNH05606.1 AbrB/MazE/SpoVT family DNA-binding domain-containing protein [Pasteurellaceae bacterium Phil11]TNH24344.1 AbrB/MazE/SpoVT family DNA-binding domain-containing protein [Testudinibacter sp. TR-2022]TNH25012.1 AbrB/MazE/SpoVT family DNA-binding domain-containing protein [Testudinibacter sp. TR-2022]
METAKIFTTGRSQAVRLPKKYRFDGDEVSIKHFGNGVLLLPLDNPWQMMAEALDEFETDFEIMRAEQTATVREELL